jgi:two-component system response regulator YesN
MTFSIVIMVGGGYFLPTHVHEASYFSTLFKKETGKTFSEYLIELRISRARSMLTDSDEAVSAIAGQVGYADLKYFSKIFKRLTGLTPSEYRKLYQKVH